MRLLNQKLIKKNFEHFNKNQKKEHVTTFYQNFKKFKIYKLKNDIDQSKINLSIENLEDFNNIKKLIYNSNF